MTNKSLAVLFALAMASCSLVASASASEAVDATADVKEPTESLESLEQPSTTFGPVQPQEKASVSSSPRVARFQDREVVHDSILRLMQIRPTQARQDPDKFWVAYEIDGKPATLEQTITLSVEEMPVREVLKYIAENAGTRFETQPGAQERLITIDLQEVPFELALKQVSRAAEVVPIYDRFVDSYVLANLRPPQPVTEVEDFAVPLRNSDPAAFMAMARKLGYDPGDGIFTVNAENTGYLYTGEVDAIREFRSLVRNLDRRPPPEGAQFTHEVIELKHQAPRTIMLELWRTYPGNFGMLENKLAIITTPESLDAIRKRVAEYDQPVDEP